MKNLLLLCVILGVSFCAYAQNVPKNELSLGYFSAGEFFDETPAKFSVLDKGRNFSINYTRLLDKNLSIGMTYLRAGFAYIPNEVDRFYLDNYTIEDRFQRILTTNLGLSISKWSMVMRAKAGIRYNLRSSRFTHIAGGMHSGGWYESFGRIDHYAKLGLSTGISIAHSIYGPIFGEFDSEFAKMFSGADRNQLLLSYRIGIRF